MELEKLYLIKLDKLYIIELEKWDHMELENYLEISSLLLQTPV